MKKPAGAANDPARRAVSAGCQNSAPPLLPGAAPELDRLSRAVLLREALEAALGRHPDTLRLSPLKPMQGGCINQAATVEACGRRLFVKWNDRPLAGQFEAEALGLQALGAAGSGLRIPEPICWADEGPGRSFLVLEYLEPGRRAPDFEEQFGRGLAALHKQSSTRSITS